VSGAISLRGLGNGAIELRLRRLDMDATVALQPYVGGKCGHAQGHRIQDRGGIKLRGWHYLPVKRTARCLPLSMATLLRREGNVS